MKVDIVMMLTKQVEQMGEEVGLEVEKVEKVLIEFVFASVLMVVVEAEAEVVVVLVVVVVAEMGFVMVVELEVHYCCQDYFVYL